MADRGEQTREKLVATAEALILRHGYAGMSLDELLRATGLTKGAFFHHFATKAELARAVLERYAETDLALFQGWSAQADRLSDDPLERVLIFLRLFEEHLDARDEPPPGCVFASFTYERAQFDAALHATIGERLAAWQAVYEAKLAALIAQRPPVVPVAASELAEMIVTLIEGAFVVGNIHRDARLLQRQSRQFRTFLELLFRSGR